LAGTTVAALGDVTRCQPPSQRLKDRGLLPSAYAPGARRRPGALTKAGPPQARRALLEGAWACRDPAPGSRHLQRRLDKKASRRAAGKPRCGGVNATDA
jgi:transposase